MYQEFIRRGHKVHVYTPIPNALWPFMPPFDPSSRYDLGVLNHSNCLTFLRDKAIAKIIYTSHGVIPQPEWPVDGADVYVAVSEEVRDGHKMEGYDARVIRNPVDLHRYRSTREPNKALKSVLFLSNYGWTVEEMTRVAADGLDFVRMGGAERRRDIEEWINSADLVVGLGRTVYESMACERNVVIHDYQGGDGFVTPQNMSEFRLKNCSGRTNRYKYTAQELRDVMDKYDPDLGPQLRAYIERSEEHTSELQSHSFISYAVFCLKKKRKRKK